MQARPLRVYQAGFGGISAIRGIIHRLSLRDADGHVKLLGISPCCFRKHRRGRRVFAQHHIKLLCAVGLFRRLPHQRKRLGVISLILIDLNQVSVCARMRGRDIVNQRFINRLGFINAVKLRIGLRHQNERIDVFRLAVNRDLQRLNGAGVICLI